MWPLKVPPCSKAYIHRFQHGTYLLRLWSLWRTTWRVVSECPYGTPTWASTASFSGTGTGTGTGTPVKVVFRCCGCYRTTSSFLVLRTSH